MQGNTQRRAARSCAAVVGVLMAFAAGAAPDGAAVTAQRLATPSPAEWVAPGRDAAGFGFASTGYVGAGLALGGLMMWGVSLVCRPARA